MQKVCHIFSLSAINNNLYEMTLKYFQPVLIMQLHVILKHNIYI